MVPLTALLGLAAVALGLVLTPGPNMVYLASRSITQGRAAGLVSLAGVGTGFAVYIALTAAGLSALFVAVPAVYAAVKLGGAAYLLWLAWQAVRPGGASAFAPRDLPADPPRRLYTMGLVTSLLNPKIAILYLSLLPQFADPARGRLPLQIVELGLAQAAVAITVNGLIVLAAGSIAAFLARRPLWQRAQRYLMGTVLAALALRIGLDRSRAALTA
ncbi:LysE family translocator [Actinomadura parmotrematis]|uniref:LysE family translocator n=1 Tax=Actinomadura parmotrematis TaxID=2864039 RepID=A0ABS7FQZ3_9ACTN|nr:LysE family translocator [Actinomadura parmotrematis]MBW8482811.1 LysE family translocator [Actinomadura parmotrematis]